MSTQTNMEPGFLERLGDKFNSFTEGVMNLITRIMGGNPSERTVKSLGYYRPKGSVEHAVIPGSVLGRVNDLEPKMKELSDDEIAALTEWVKSGVPWPAATAPTAEHKQSPIELANSHLRSQNPITARTRA